MKSELTNADTRKKGGKARERVV